jgi:pimeloyl-ACP methyl ester carboxylesterase
MTSAELDPASEIEDRVGLDNAYADPHNVWMSGDSLYISGTHSMGDVADDLALPFGLTRGTQRFDEASRVLKANPRIRRVVGHSLGGAVTLELGKMRPDLKTRTYGAPVVSMSGGERYRSAGDPVSAFDWGAKTTLPTSLNPHSYQDLAQKMHTPGPNVGAGSYDLNGITHAYR